MKKFLFNTVVYGKKETLLLFLKGTNLDLSIRPSINLYFVLLFRNYNIKWFIISAVGRYQILWWSSLYCNQKSKKCLIGSMLSYIKGMFGSTSNNITELGFKYW